MRWVRFLILAVLLAAVPGFADTTTRYLIGPDGDPVFPVSRSIYSISTVGRGGRSLAFNGGLAFNANNYLFCSIANNGFGNSSLVSFRPVWFMADGR